MAGQAPRDAQEHQGRKMRRCMVLAVRKAVVLSIVMAVVVEKNGQTAFFGPTLERERSF